VQHAIDLDVVHELALPPQQTVVLDPVRRLAPIGRHR